MNNKPQTQKEVALERAIENARAIYFYATPDAAEEFEAYGTVEVWAFKNQYRLLVDPRFDFGEVVNYIVNYGKQ